MTVRDNLILAIGSPQIAPGDRVRLPVRTPFRVELLRMIVGQETSCAFLYSAPFTAGGPLLAHDWIDPNETIFVDAKNCSREPLRFRASVLVQTESREE